MNLNRCPFLKFALSYIDKHPKSSKMDVVMAAGSSCRYTDVPNRTKAYRYKALDRLIEEGYIKSGYSGGRYNLEVCIDR
jgi:hypothetical protein